MPYHILVKISGAVTIVFGMISAYRILNLLKIKRLRVIPIDIIYENSQDLVIIEGIVQPNIPVNFTKASKTFCSKNKTIHYGLHNKFLSSNTSQIIVIPT